MKIRALLTLLMFLIFFACYQKTTRNILIQKKPEANSIRIVNDRICFAYQTAFHDTTFDKLHGYHKMAELFSNPGQLANFLNQYEPRNQHVKVYLESLKHGDYNGRKLNSIAIFAELYWRLVEQIYISMPYYKLEGKLRIVEIPLHRFESDIIDQLNSDFLFMHQLTVAVDFKNSLKKASSLVVGDPDDFLTYLSESMESVFKEYIAIPKADTCASFPFTELPIDIENAFSYFKETGLDFDEFTKHLNQYRISPVINASPGKTPEFELKFMTDVMPTNIIRIPIPISLRKSTRDKIYIKNASRAVIGNLLRTGISREFIVIVKLADLTHRQFFENYIENVETAMNQHNNYYRIIENAKISVSNPRTLFYRLKIVPYHSNCGSIQAINKAINDSKKFLEKHINEDNELRHRYFIKTKWQQVIIFQPQEI